MYDSFFIDSQLRDLGVQIVTVGEILPEDEGLRYAIQGLYASMAHNFIINHRSNVVRGLKYNAEKCLYNGRKILGYIGKKDQKYKIDPQTAPIVQRIFTDYAAGKPLQIICNELNDSGFRSVYGNKFIVNSLSNILQNRAYLGEYKYGDFICKDGMPRIISDELFHEVEIRRNKNKRGGTGKSKKNVIRPDSCRRKPR